MDSKAPVVNGELNKTVISLKGRSENLSDENDVKNSDTCFVRNISISKDSPVELCPPKGMNMPSTKQARHLSFPYSTQDMHTDVSTNESQKENVILERVSRNTVAESAESDAVRRGEQRINGEYVINDRLIGMFERVPNEAHDLSRMHEDILNKINRYIHDGIALRGVVASDGKTLLYHVVGKRLLRVTSLLIEHGVDPMQENVKMETNADTSSTMQDSSTKYVQGNLNRQTDNVHKKTFRNGKGNAALKVTTEETDMTRMPEKLSSANDANKTHKSSLSNRTCQKVMVKKPLLNIGLQCFGSKNKTRTDMDGESEQLFEECSLPLELAIKKAFDDVASVIVQKTPTYTIRMLFETRRLQIEDILKHEMEQTLIAVLDALMEPKLRGMHSIYPSILEADDHGNVPGDALFDKTTYTAFQTLVKDGRKEVICHPVMRVLIQHKWESWCKFRLSSYSVLYLISLFCLTFAVVTSATADDVLRYTTHLQRTRAVAEVVSYIYACLIFTTEVRQICRHKFEYFKQLCNYFEIMSSALIVTSLPVRYAYVQVHWYVLAAGYMFWVLRIFKYTAVFSHFGLYAEALKRILMVDFIQFMCVFSIILLAFAGSFLLVLKGDELLISTGDTSSFGDVLYLGLRTMIEAGPVLEYADYKPMSAILVSIFLFVTIVVMLNILIAQLSNTYQNIQDDSVKSLISNRAWIIVRAERNEWRMFPANWKRGKHFTREIENVNLATLSPQLHPSFGDKLNEAVSVVTQKQIDNGLQIKTVKNRLTTSSQALETRICQIQKTTNRLEKELREIKQLLLKH